MSDCRCWPTNQRAGFLVGWFWGLKPPAPGTEAEVRGWADAFGLWRKQDVWHLAPWIKHWADWFYTLYLIFCGVNLYQGGTRRHIGRQKELGYKQSWIQGELDTRRAGVEVRSLSWVEWRVTGGWPLVTLRVFNQSLAFFVRCPWFFKPVRNSGFLVFRWTLAKVTLNV